MLTSTMRTQLQEWLCEGHDTADIIAQARHTWPGVPEDEIRQALPSCAEASATDARTLLDTITQKRLAEIDRLEQRLQDKECPMAVHTLYRGLLRDTEAQCYKLLTLDRPAAPKKQPVEKAAPSHPTIKETIAEKPVASPSTARKLVNLASLIVFALLSLLSCAAQVRTHPMQGSNSTPLECPEALAAILPTTAPHAIVPDSYTQGCPVRCGLSSSLSPSLSWRSWFCPG